MKSCPQCLATYPDNYTVCPKDGARLAGSSLWIPGSVIRGKYKLIAKIGAGGMATVYKAHHELLNEPRALKVIGWELARDEQFAQRFKNEAIITRKLQHPNAVRVDDLDIAEDGRPFIAMELVEGESLKVRMIRSGQLPATLVLEIARQVCEALEAAHALGLIHRDIKPDNIVLVPRPGGRPLVKILDFGIARLREASPDVGRAEVTLTETGAVIGTPDYISPEQATGKRGDELDGRSDLYSLGIVMYRMLTGEPPFKADTTVEMILHHIRTVPKPPHAVKAALNIPDSVSAIVMSALEKDRNRRFASAAAMAKAIRGVKDSLTMVGPPTMAVPGGARATVSPHQGARAAGAGIQAVHREAQRTAAVPPTAPARAEAKGFPIVRVVGGIIVALVLIASIAALRRRQPAQPPPVPADAAAPSGQDSTPTVDTGSFGREAGNGQADSDEKAESPTKSTTPLQSSPPFPQPQENTTVRQTEADRFQGPANRDQKIRRLHEEATRYVAQREYLKAANTFRQILALDPNNKRARTALRRLMQQVRRKKAERARPTP